MGYLQSLDIFLPTFLFFSPNNNVLILLAFGCRTGFEANLLFMPPPPKKGKGKDKGKGKKDAPSRKSKCPIEKNKDGTTSLLYEWAEM